MVTTMYLQNKIPRVGLLALMARTLSFSARETVERVDAQRHSKAAVSVISDFGVAPSFPGLR